MFPSSRQVEVQSSTTNVVDDTVVSDAINDAQGKDKPVEQKAATAQVTAKNDESSADDEADLIKLEDSSLIELQVMQSHYVEKLKELRHVVKSKAKGENVIRDAQKKYDELVLRLSLVDAAIKEKQDFEAATAKVMKQFHQAYERIKRTVYSLRYAHKEEVVATIQDDIEELNKLENELREAYDCYRSLIPPSADVRRRADGGRQICTDMRGILEHIQDNPMTAGERKLLLKGLCKDDPGLKRSIFGSQADERSESEFTQLSRSALSVSTRQKLAELDAQRKRTALNAKMIKHKAAMESIQEQLHIVDQEEKLQKEEIDWYQESILELPPSKVSNKSHLGESFHLSLRPVKGETPNLLDTHQPTTQDNSQLALIAQTFSDSINKSRLPVSTPPIFDGDPLKFINFKKSFVALVENKGIPPADKLYYLQQYLTGEAKSAVEGCFFGSNEIAYQTAWKKLEKRFGHPFTVQQALRKKLQQWPKVSAKDEKALQDFADFLHTLMEARPHVDGLMILDDCVQIQEMAFKLPEWCNRRWTRIVTTAINEKNRYPGFDSFVNFVSEEAQVATNPICVNPQLQRVAASQDKDVDTKSKAKRTPGIAHAIKSEGGRSPRSQNSSKRYPVCSMCESEQHPIWRCAKFKELSYDDKVKMVQSKRLCFKCLCNGHSSKTCQAKIVCNICRGNHQSLLHRDKLIRSESRPTSGNPQEDAGPNAVKIAISNKASQDSARSYTTEVLPVWVKTGQSGAQEVLTYALIDSQSDSSYITEELAEKLSLPYEPIRMKVTTMTSVSVVDCKRYEDVKIRGFDMNVEVNLKSCYTTPHIPHDRDHIPSKVAISKMPHLAHIAPLIPPLQDCEVGLLIGYSCPQALRPVDIVSGNPDEAFAVKTDLGWSVVGGDSCTSNGRGLCHRMTSKELIIPSPCEVIKVLDQDFRDVKDDIGCSQDDLAFLRVMEGGIKFNEDTGKVSMPLPLKNNCKFPNNYGMALSRLNTLKRKLSKNETFRTHYCEFMKQMIDKRFAEPVPPPSQGEVVNYIPHQGVYHPLKPGKIRVVFDASAKHQDVSLNDNLLKGPDLTNDLLGVLLRFRQDKIALTCDIEQMFYNFEVNQEQRNLLRFLWWPNGDVTLSPKEYRLTVHLFGATSSPACATYGIRYLAKLYEKDFPQGASFLTRNLYVDDGLCSISTSEEALSLVSQATGICKKGNIRLHKFLSNSKEVLEAIPPSERAATVSEIDLELEPLPVERTLGVRWDIQEDCFVFKVVLQDKPNTRRGILSSVMSVYDPNGFVSPVVLRGRQILQDLCKQKKSWDEPVDTETAERWEEWKADLSDLQTFKIPRCIKPDSEVAKYELHHFSDASTKGYGQCSYVRMCCNDGSVDCVLLMSKARVAPSKVVSIPRLELTAATLSVKVSRLLRKELEIPIHEEHYWTDSKVVLGYIANDAKRFHVFVSNRVQYIRDNTDIRQWHYVPTKLNPADLASRGTSAKELSSSIWLKGPKYMLNENIPITMPDVSLNLGDPEVKSQCLVTSSVCLSTGLLDRLERFSKWESIVSALVILIRRIKGKQSRVTENQNAANLVLRWLQVKAFSEDISLLQKTGNVASTSCLRNLDPMLDASDIIRVGSRIQSSQNVTEGERHPVILPRKEHVTRKIIEHIHERTNHGGRSLTLNELRTQGFYVQRGSKVVAQVIHDCVKCRKQRRPAECQKMADLPPERTEMQPVFYCSGMDVFGPYLIKRARSEVKRYALLFTCLYSRAIHLELLDDLTTDCFLNALRCFMALRGVVKEVFCDRGSNFVGGDNELKQALTELDHDQLELFLASKQVGFKFNVPHASEQGGVWERQIRTVRNVLKSVIEFANARLDDSSLRTLMYEASYIVNSRPLSPASLNDPLADPPITPNALLHGKLEGVLPPPGSFCAQDVYARKRWRRVQYLSEMFWNKWKKEYLLNLQERRKWHKPRRNLQNGDIVLVVEDTLPRCQWPLAIVTNTKIDGDGLVRKVMLNVSNMQSVEQGKKLKGMSQLERPVQKVVLLVPVSHSNDDKENFDVNC